MSEIPAFSLGHLVARDASTSECFQSFGTIVLHGQDFLDLHHKIKFALINQPVTKKQASKIIDEIYRHCGPKATVLFADKMMKLGFTHACKAGISIGKDDMIVPEREQ